MYSTTYRDSDLSSAFDNDVAESIANEKRLQCQMKS